MYTPSECERKLINLYDSTFENDCELCLKCRNEVTDLSRPVSAWMVGCDFKNQNIRLLFVGKTARGDFEKTDCKYINVFAHSRELFNTGWHYWTYTKEIAKKIFGDEWMERIAVTNIVKCNNSESVDTSTECMKNNCIIELGMLRKEISAINPTHVIFYTGWAYDEYIKYAFDEIVEPGDWSSTKLIGRYCSPWNEGTSKVSGRTIHFLRICHPERKKKDDFVNSVYDWIIRTDTSHK